MKKNQISKQRLSIIIMLFISFAVLLALADRAPMHLENRFSCVDLRTDVIIYVNGVTEVTSSGPYVYRVFIPYLATGINSVLPFISLVNLDLLLKIFFLIVCQLTFFYYLRNFFSDMLSLMGVFVLDILLGFTFSSIIGPSIGENADLLNLAVFILVLNALYKNKFLIAVVFLFIGTFNRETTLFLIPIIFMHDLILKKGMLRTVAALFAVAIPYIGLRMIIQPSVPDWFTFEALIKNIPLLSAKTTSSAVIANLHVAFLLLPLIVLSLLNFSQHPQFLRIAAYITPLFILVHYLIGNIIETRLWIPLFTILIPLSLNTLSMILNNETQLSPTHQQAGK